MIIIIYLEWIPGSHRHGVWDYDEIGLSADLLHLNLNFMEQYQTYEKKLRNTINDLKLKSVPAILKKGI